MISSRPMSGASSQRTTVRIPRARAWAAIAFVILGAAAACSKEEPGRQALGEATAFYRQGKCAEALPLLRKAQESGLKDGTLEYELGYCREAVGGKPEDRRATWREAQTLLAAEIGRKDGATLERLYELSVIHSDREEWDSVKQYGRQAIELFEKGPDPNALSGEDWFRLGRLHDLLVEPSEAEAAYRRSVSSFGKEKGGSAIYRSLALAKVGEFDLHMGRYTPAADAFDEAVNLFPANSQIHPFLHGLALLAAHRFDAAVGRFSADQSETNAESQYGADLARKAGEVAPLEDKDKDGTLLRSIPDEALQARVREAAQSLRAAREKNSYRPGDPLPAEVALHQKRFVTLLAEYFVRAREMQEFCLREHMADLVRR